ncbi:hypothetical protein Q5705_20835 [Kosakonia sp. H02]|nr:hypothetical protein Q5705_20835 [Kosakonia sp. H02]
MRFQVIDFFYGLMVMVNRISVTLPVDGLLFWKLSGREALSEAFTLSLTVLGTDARTDRSRLLGQPVTCVHDLHVYTCGWAVKGSYADPFFGLHHQDPIA